MIIGISGKIGSGKDLVGQIIQYLTSEGEKIGDFNYWSSNYTARKEQNALPQFKWQIKKFADKLKDIVCLLIGCTREQLEDREFKEEELGEEWWHWYMVHDGGYSNTLLDYQNTTKKELREYEDLELVKLTPRKILQIIGTDLFRNQLHPQIWVNALMADYKEIDRRSWQDPDDSNIKYPNWIITDTRFVNEADAIKSKGGINIRVNRPCKECGTCVTHKMSCSYNTVQHESETALDNYNFDYIITNDGTIEELIEKVKVILIKEDIII